MEFKSFGQICEVNKKMTEKKERTEQKTFNDMTLFGLLM